MQSVSSQSSVSTHRPSITATPTGPAEELSGLPTESTATVEPADEPVSDGTDAQKEQPSLVIRTERFNGMDTAKIRAIPVGEGGTTGVTGSQASRQVHAPQTTRPRAHAEATAPAQTPAPPRSVLGSIASAVGGFFGSFGKGISRLAKAVAAKFSAPAVSTTSMSNFDRYKALTRGEKARLREQCNVEFCAEQLDCFEAGLAFINSKKDRKSFEKMMAVLKRNPPNISGALNKSLLTAGKAEPFDPVVAATHVTSMADEVYDMLKRGPMKSAGIKDSSVLRA